MLGKREKRLKTHMPLSSQSVSPSEGGTARPPSHSQIPPASPASSVKWERQGQNKVLSTVPRHFIEALPLGEEDPAPQ